MGGGVGLCDARLASRRERALRVRDAGGRHRFFPRRRRDLCCCRGLPHRIGVYFAVTGLRAERRRRRSRSGWRQPSFRVRLSRRSGEALESGRAARDDDRPVSRLAAALAVDGRRPRRSRPLSLASIATAILDALASRRTRAARAFAATGARGHGREVADEPGDRAAADGARREPRLRGGDADRNFASSRASAAAMISTKACARRSSTRTIARTGVRPGEPSHERTIDAYFAPLGADELDVSGSVADEDT